MCGKELLQLFPNSPQSSTCRCTAARSSADRYSSCTHSHARPSGARRGVETIEAVHSWGPHAPPKPAGHAPASSRSRLRDRWHRGTLATGRSTLRRQASSAAAAPLQTSPPARSPPQPPLLPQMQKKKSLVLLFRFSNTDPPLCVCVAASCTNRRKAVG